MTTGQTPQPRARKLGARRWGVCLALVLPSLALGGDALADDGWQFEVVDIGQHRVVLSYGVTAGDTVLMEHTHSFHHRPVYEVFSVSQEGELAMEEMRFDRNGANLPSGPETVDGVTTTFLSEPGGYRVLHHGRPLGSVQLAVGGDSVDHTLTLPTGERVRLLDLVERGTHVELRVE